MSAKTYAPFVRSQRPVAWPAIVLVLTAIALALVLGLVSSIGNVLIGGMLVGLVAVVAVMGSPRALFWATVVGSLVVVGLLELYLPGLQFARWIFPVASAMFLVSVILAKLWTAKPLPASNGHGLLVACLAFIATVGLSIAINWQGAGFALAGVKNYFQAWGLLLGLALIAHWPNLERQLPKLLVGIALIQLPFVLHQFLYLAPLRGGQGIIAVDIVAGTFGASFEGGGNNALLAMFQVIVATLLLAYWRRGTLNGWWLVVCLPVMLGPLFLNESKISVFYVFIGFVVVFRRDIAKHPLRFIGLTVGMAAVSFALVLSYSALHPWKQHASPGDLVEHVFRQNTQEGERYGSLALNRTTALTHWSEEQSHYPLARTLFGHGPTASKIDSAVLDVSGNLASRRYPGMGIGVTAASSLLWDVGVVGFSLVLIMMGAAFVTAGRLARVNQKDPRLCALFEALQAATVTLTLSLFHKSFFNFLLGYQVVFSLILGFLIYATRHLSVEIEAAPARPAPRRAA